MTESKNSSFLHKKFRGLNTSPEVKAVVKREVAKESESPARNKRTKELLQQKPEARIQAYLDYLQECISIPEDRKRVEKMNHIKGVLHDKYITKLEDIPDSYWESIRRRHHEEGRGEIEIPDELKAKLASDIMSEQTNSLDMWTDYLASSDAAYPDWFKYFAFRSILRLNKYDKEKNQFTKRTKGTVSPFPDLNREALALVCEALTKKQTGEIYDVGFDVTSEDKAKWQQYLQQESFAKMYAWAHEHFNPIPEELLQKTNGEWRSFPQGSDPQELVKSISAYSTGWCIRGLTTATDYLSHSNLEIYFSEDKDSEFTIPRLVVVTRDDQTQEMRGVAYQENHDEYIGEVADHKLDELPDGHLYRKKSQDMKQMTAIYNKCFQVDRKTKQKTYLNPKLSVEELKFLYEIDSSIQNFGYENKDPRIKELRSQRDPKADAPVVFECEPNQIAYNQNEVNENTKAYIGPLFPNIFKILKNIEHIYTEFPEGKIRRHSVEIGGQSKEELKKTLETGEFKTSSYVDIMMDNPDFTTSKKKEDLNLIELKVGDLSFDNNPTTDEIYQRIEEFGLELCPAETGPHFRLQYTDQPQGEWIRVGMKQIDDSGGNPHVFGVGADGDELWLSDAYWTRPGPQWHDSSRFVFRIRK